MTTDPNPFEEGERAPRERTFPPTAIRIGTAATNIRSGPPVTKELPARPKPTSRNGLERRPRSAGRAACSRHS
jgi:hypothetical protein